MRLEVSVRNEENISVVVTKPCGLYINVASKQRAALSGDFTWTRLLFEILTQQSLMLYAHALFYTKLKHDYAQNKSTLQQF